nr:hypothetical protein [Tanacetum cinerariifolium]
MQQLANLLSGFQKQFPPTNNQLRASSNLRNQVTVQAGKIVTETVQRSSPGNVGKQGKRENQANGSKVVCYNYRGEGHVARQCKEPKQARNSQWYADKALLLNAKEKGEVLDAEAEAFLADLECTAPYEGQLAMTSTNMFQANHEDAYYFDVDDGPDASIAFMAKFSSAGSPSSSNNISINEEEGIESDNESLPEENTIPYSKHMASNDDLYKVDEERNQTLKEKTQTIDTLTTELERYKLKVEQLDKNRVKRELEMALAERKKCSNELEKENIQLRTAIKGRDASLESVKSEKTNIISEKKSLEAKYVDEIILLTNANKFAAGLLQKFQMPTQTIPMLSKTSKIAYQDLHKTGLGFANPWYGKKARLSHTSLYYGEGILKPVYLKPLVHDSKETTALSEVSRATMSKKPGHVQPINYDKLNALYSQFVPQKELSCEQVYWQSPANVSPPTTPVKPFVKPQPAPSQVREKLECIKKTFPGFEKLVKDNSVVRP